MPITLNLYTYWTSPCFCIWFPLHLECTSPTYLSRPPLHETPKSQNRIILSFLPDHFPSVILILTTTCYINYRRQYKVVAKKRSFSVRQIWFQHSIFHPVAIWLYVSWLPPPELNFLINKTSITHESTSKCYCECIQHCPSLRLGNIQQSSRAQMRITTICLRLGLLPQEKGPCLNSSPQDEKGDAHTKMFNHFWVIWETKLQAIFILLLCAFLH